MFHVEHSVPGQIGAVGLFSDAEIAENYVQDVFDIDAAGQTFQGAGGHPKFLR